ncbi:hypothetical protein Scep_013489 [Stephania cephalantha]|uniref:Uncharacterized protein n=1 Tax=Stephania cephalantha TaxID=152367 RepID=A0AAP0PAU0_9MAGN
MKPSKKTPPLFSLSRSSFSPLSISLLLSPFSPPHLSRSPSRLARALGLAPAASRSMPRDRHCLATAAASRPPPPRDLRLATAASLLPTPSASLSRSSLFIGFSYLESNNSMEVYKYWNA